MSRFRRAAFFPDTFHEVNGVAHTSRHFEQFVRNRQIPFLSVRPGAKTGIENDGTVTMLNLKRSPLSFALDAHLDLDPLLLRHAGRVLREARRLNIELVHITGPGDMGQLGCYVAWRLGVPVVMGWHTNLHEYAEKRAERLFCFLNQNTREALARRASAGSLSLLGQLYRRAGMILAPNPELVSFAHELSNKPAYLMQRGVDVSLFHPAKRNRTDRKFRIGYVGRLTAEKNVRFLAELGRALARQGRREFELYIVGQGREHDWLAANIPNAVLTGVLQGEALARAYADMDLFVFPSKTDTFGNVILEALASGLPCIVTASGGPKHLVQSGVTGYVAEDDAAFIKYTASLMSNLDAHWQMKEAARHYACGQSWSTVFETVFRNYDNCLTARAQAQSQVRTKSIFRRNHFEFSITVGSTDMPGRSRRS